MNALTPTPSTPPSRPTSPELSPPLEALLDAPGSHEAAVRDIARFVAYREEARQALPALKAVAEFRSGEAGVQQVIGKRFAIYPQPKRSDGEWNAWWSEYYAVLADVPLASLEAAMRAWVASPESRFLPSPGELRKLALLTPSRSIQRYQRARAAVEMGDEQTERERIAADMARRGTTAREQSEAIRGMLAGLQRELKATAEAQIAAIGGKGIPFPKRCVMPSNRPLTETQKRILRACGMPIE